MSAELFVLVGDSGTVLTSPDGTTWTERTTPNSDDLSDVCYAPGIGLIVAVSEDGPTIASNDEGATWSQLSTTAFATIAWSEPLGLFVAATGTSSFVQTSPDGVAWTGRSTNFLTERVRWSDALSLFVAVGGDGFVSAIQTSPDGVAWTERTVDNLGNRLSVIAQDPETGKLVAARATVNEVVYSEDAVNWNTSTDEASARALGWLASVGRFYSEYEYSDDDGETWTAQSLSGFRTVTAAAASPTLAVMADNGGRIWTSTDADSWTSRTSPVSVSLNAGLHVTLNTAPNAPVLVSPTAGATIDRTASQRFDWDFSDPDDGDSQSAFRLRIYPSGSGTPVVDVEDEIPTTHYDLAVGELAAGDYEWEAETADAQGEWGPPSAREPFTAATPPAGPTLTAPANDATIAAETATAEWSTPSQSAYQLRVTADDAGNPDTAEVRFDTGTVNSSGARSRIVEFPTNQVTEHIQVRVRRDGLWSPWSTVRVDVDYTVPATPTCLVDDTSTDGAITIAADHPAPVDPEPTVESHDIERRKVGGDGIRIAAEIAPGSTFTDWTVASGAIYEYRIRARGDNGTSSYSAWTS